MLMMNYPLLFIKPKVLYVPRLWGFKLHSSAENHPPKVKYDSHSSSLQVSSRPAAHFAQDAEVRVPIRTFLSNAKH